MFYLNRNGATTNANATIEKSTSSKEEEEKFGWWVGAREFANFANIANSTVLSDTKESNSSTSSASMLSCIDFDDSDAYTLAMDFPKDFPKYYSRAERDDNYENIELMTFSSRRSTEEEFSSEEFDENSAKDAETASTRSQTDNEDLAAKDETKEREPRGMCYTPERLVRCEDYRILTTSPRFFAITREGMLGKPENSRKMRFANRRQLNFLAESTEIVTPTTATEQLPEISPEMVEITRDSCHQSKRQPKEEGGEEYHWQNHPAIVITDEDQEEKSNGGHSQDNTKELCDTSNLKGCDNSSDSSRSSYERLSIDWEDLRKGSTRRSSSLEDTSGIHSNEWSSATPSDTQINSLCLCDELAVASNRCASDFTQEGGDTAINEVVSILRVLESDPEKAQILLEEDRFSESASSHDRLTRLALTIETDASVPTVFGHPENLLLHLQQRVDRMRLDNKDIFRDIYALRKDFQYEEKKLHDLNSDATKLREEIHEVHYMDDLLNLLQGELERISDRNWPFVIGHGEHHGELNLVV